MEPLSTAVRLIAGQSPAFAAGMLVVVLAVATGGWKALKGEKPVLVLWYTHKQSLDRCAKVESERDRYLEKLDESSHINADLARTLKGLTDQITILVNRDQEGVS